MPPALPVNGNRFSSAQKKRHGAFALCVLCKAAIPLNMADLPSTCCQSGQASEKNASRRADDGSDERATCCSAGAGRFDYLLWGSALACGVGLSLHFTALAKIQWLAGYSHAVTALLGQMWWGIVLGFFVVGILERLPREIVINVLGARRGPAGIGRAIFAGLLLDLCNHGILLVAMSLYRRGASLGQTIAFLVASPWNSLALTLVLVALIGLPWTLLFVLCSALVAFVAGMTVDYFVEHGKLHENRHRGEVPEGFRLWPELKTAFAGTNIASPRGLLNTLLLGVKQSRMILRWLFFGIVLAALIQALVSTEFMRDWFGPSLIGLALTLVAATVIEVCSEGSTPIAADLFNRAGAPGNAFTFLMAGAATDYTEIMALRETTGRWSSTLILPLLTVPQVLLIGWIMNSWS